MLKNELELYENVQIILTRIDNASNPSLSERAKLANDEKCDLFLSCHLNAFNGVARGTETIHSIYANGRFQAFSKMLGVNLSQALNIPFRRTFSKEGNNGDYYAVIRETSMPAMIIEALFLDNQLDNKAYNPKIISESISDTIAKTYNLQLKKQAINTLYRVVCGSFSVKENADKRVQELKKAGFESFITVENK
jgi:N-acetylmuramoyl-L-alanine amidase